MVSIDDDDDDDGDDDDDDSSSSSIRQFISSMQSILPHKQATDWKVYDITRTINKEIDKEYI